MSSTEVGGPAINSPQARAAQRAEFLDARLNVDSCDEASVARALLLVAELDGLEAVANECRLSAATLRRQLGGSFPLYLGTVLLVTRALGLQLRVEAAAG